MSRTPLHQSPARDFNIISNQYYTPAHLSLPKISKHSSFLESKSPQASTHVNKSSYNFDIITSRALKGETQQALPLTEPEKISNKKLFLITKYAEETGISSTRFRDSYENFSSNKRFNRKKGMVQEFLGKEVNTITGWMRKH